MSERVRFALAAFWLAVFPTSSYTQTFQAQITGVVKDQSDAVVPGAQLSAKNVATGVLYSTVSNDTGLYRFPNLPPAPVYLWPARIRDSSGSKRARLRCR